MSHTLSTIIVNYNAGSLLHKCVDSLLVCPLDIEIIVVDNASSDPSLDGLQDLSQVCVSATRPIWALQRREISEYRLLLRRFCCFSIPIVFSA